MEEEDDDANLESFLQWAAELRISDGPSSSCLGDTLCVSHFPLAGGRGLGAARAINRGELVLRVPKAALMTSDCLIRNDPKFSRALKEFPSLSHDQILSVALLNEVNKGKSSMWYPYIKLLPRSYDLLESFSPFEIEALQIDDALSTAEMAVQKSKKEWEEAAPFMRTLNLKLKLINFSAWLWASATISSRTMHIPWDAAGCLCPVGDFFNYAPPGEDPNHTKNLDTDRLVDAGYNEKEGSYCFYAKKDYGKGDQVLLSYGTYTNLELLEHYGFLLQDNPNDKAFVPLEEEMYLLCSWPNDSIYIYQDGKPSFALLSTLRLWATPPTKRKSVKHIVYSGDRISDKNESAAMKWIAKKCETTLKSYSTSIAEDTLLVNVIDKIQCYNPKEGEYEVLPTTIHDEIRRFLECNSFMKSPRRSIHHWKQAVEWRLRYKRILLDCISYCHRIFDNYDFATIVY